MAEMPPLGTPGIAPPRYEEGTRARGPNGELAVFTNGEWKIKNVTAEDVKNVAVPSLVRGGASLLSTGRGMYDAATTGLGWLADKALPVDTAETVKTAMKELPQGAGRYNPVLAPFLGPTQEELIKKAEGLTGNDFSARAETPIGQGVQTALELAPAIAAGPGSLLRKGGSWLGATLGSEGAGALAQAKAPEYEGWARALGSGLGTYAPTVARRALTPLPVSAQRQAENKLLSDAGIQQRAGQSTGRQFLNTLELDNITRAPKDISPAGQRAQFGQFAQKEAGVAGPQAAQGITDLAELNPTMRATGKNIEAGYQAARPRTDKQLTDAMRDVWANATPATQKVLDPYFTQIMHRPTPAGASRINVPGKGYLVTPNSRLKGDEVRQQVNSLTQEADKLAKLGDVQSAGSLRELGGTLRSAVDRSLVGTPHENLPVQRGQYTNQRALKDLNLKQGATPDAGLPPMPHDVYGALGAVKNPRARESNLGKVADLAGRRGVGVASTPDFSSYFHHPGWTIGGALAGGAGQYLGGKNDSLGGVDFPITGILSAGALAAYARSNPLMAQALLNPGTQAWLKNQRFQPGRHTAPSNIAAALAMAGSPTLPEDTVE